MSTATPDRERAVPTDARIVGRDQELDELPRLLANHRLVTLTGPGGVGKTRLAREVVGQAATDPVICELAPVPSSEGVPTAVAEALGFASLPAAIVGLADRACLLLVDNAEHHLDPVAGVVDDLLTECPGVTVLATSREPLELQGELVVVLGGLPVPTGDDPLEASSSPAVQLFLAHARRAGADLPPDPDTTTAVATICRRLDGLPLAIELAAARARTLTPAEILRHLDARFQLLRRRRNRGPARHRSLEATIDWSFERLDPATQRFFCRLGAFCGPFTLQAAHTVAADPDEPTTTTVDRLDALVHRSLVAVADRPGSASFQLPESVRLYARQHLADNAEDHVFDERCADHYVHVALELAGHASHSWSTETFQTLLTSQLNLQDAIRWCLAADTTPHRATALFLPLWGLVHNGRADAVHDLGQQLLERWPDPDEAGWAMVAAVTATTALVTGDIEHGRDLAARALAATDEGLGAVIAGRAASMAAALEGDDRALMGHLDRAIATAEDSHLDPFVTELLVFRALAQARIGDLAAADSAGAVANERASAGDSDILQVFARLATGAIAAARDDGDTARRTLREAVDHASRTGYPWGTGTGHRLLGAIALLDDDLEGARSHLSRALETFVSVGQLGDTATALRWIAALFARQGRPVAAAAAHPAHPDGPGLIDLLERTHLPGLLAQITPRHPAPDLRDAIAAARTALADASEDGDHPAPDDPSTDASTGGWIREGSVWALTYGGATVRLPDAKGLTDLAILLAQPGREVAATELMGTAVDSPDLGPVIDVAARKAYERRIVELQEELEEAEDFSDLVRAERARSELDQILDTLTAATGLGGRTRRTGASAERARSATTRRIRDTVRRIAEVHPALGQHLTDAVRTGQWCAYEPGTPVAWNVRPDAPSAPAASGSS